MSTTISILLLFFFNVTATTEIYTLSLHDALPISPAAPDRSGPNPAAETQAPRRRSRGRSEEHTSELQSQSHLVCRLLLEKKKRQTRDGVDGRRIDSDVIRPHHSHQQRPFGRGRGELAFQILHVEFFFNDTATTEIYTLSLHDALPI